MLEVFGYEKDGSGRYKEDQFNEEELPEEEQGLYGEDLDERANSTKTRIIVTRRKAYSTFLSN